MVLATLILAAGIANINLAVANVALPDIGQAFKASQTAIDHRACPASSDPVIAVGHACGRIMVISLRPSSKIPEVPWSE